MNEPAKLKIDNLKRAILELLGNRSGRARFVTEVAAALRQYDMGKDEMDRALIDLQKDGVVIVRDNFCADPHLANVDLRVAAFVDVATGANAQAAALREIDLAWNKWLGEFLANHRCG